MARRLARRGGGPVPAWSPLRLNRCFSSGGMFGGTSSTLLTHLGAGGARHTQRGSKGGVGWECAQPAAARAWRGACHQCFRPAAHLAASWMVGMASSSSVSFWSLL